MSLPRASAQMFPLVSDASIRDTLRRELHRSIHIEKTFSRGSLSAESCVSTDVIDGIISRDPNKHRRLKIEDVFSLAAVLGTRAVNALTCHVAHGAYPLDETGEPDCGEILATGLGHLAKLARVIADGHSVTDDPEARDAADGLIDTVTPMSSRRLHA